MTGAPTMFITPGQMQGLGKLVTGTQDTSGALARLTDPDHDQGGPLSGRWMIQLAADGDLVVRDAERLFYISPGGGIRVGGR
jgi:hypothetical protein